MLKTLLEVIDWTVVACLFLFCIENVRFVLMFMFSMQPLTCTCKIQFALVHNIATIDLSRREGFISLLHCATQKFIATNVYPPKDFLLSTSHL